MFGINASMVVAGVLIIAGLVDMARHYWRDRWWKLLASGWGAFMLAWVFDAAAWSLVFAMKAAAHG